jgi:aryl-alcohol dehydrogenase-like predicted oxidoreductase
MLTGKYRACPQFRKGDARSFFYRYFKPAHWSGVRRLVDEVEAIAALRGTTSGAVALSWLLKQPGVTSVIVGARSAEQVRGNIAGVPVDLNEDDMLVLDTFSRQVYES